MSQLIFDPLRKGDDKLNNNDVPIWGKGPYHRRSSKIFSVSEKASCGNWQQNPVPDWSNDERENRIQIKRKQF